MNILDLSEQWLIDCKPKGAKGCEGAGIDSYNKYLAEKGKVMHESKRKYKGSTKFQCPSGPYWDPGYKITKYIKKGKPTDKDIMAHIMEYGATHIGIWASNSGFGHYKSGVFDKCR